MWIRVADGPAGVTADGDLACTAGHRVKVADGSDDGIFGGWAWNGRELTVEQDRYGFFPLFEWQPPGARLVSTDLVTLLDRGAPTDLDLDALSVFVRIGFFVGDDTPFAAVRASVPPPLASRADSSISREAAVDGFITLFRQAMRRRLPTRPFVMPLSGGRDSRHILFELCEESRPPAACVTVRHFPPRSNDDELIAREVCAAVGVEHRAIAQPPDRARLERRKNAATHLCTDEHAQFVALADYLRAHTHETFDGIAGDVLSQSTYLRRDVHELFARSDFRGVAEYVLDGYGTAVSERALQRVLAPALLRELPRERAVARLTREAARHASAANPVGSFFLFNRTRREVALSPYGLMRDVVVYAPYLDRDLFDFLSALPAELLMDRTLHTEAIARAWPRHAAIPYERKGLRTEDRWAQRRIAAAVLGAVARRRSRRFFRGVALAPMLAATMADGAAHRLWPAPLVFYLEALAARAATPLTAASRRER